MSETTTTALAVIPAAQLPTIMAADGAADILARLVSELSGFVGDVTSEKGRREIASKARKAAVAKMDLIRLANTLKEDAQKTIKGVNVEIKIVEARMDDLRDSIRAPLDEFEARNAARVAALEAGIAAMEAWATTPSDWASDQIQARLSEIEADELMTRDWQEFKHRAQHAATHSINALKVAKSEAMQREAEAAEQARAAAELAEQQRLAEKLAQQEREASIAAQAAETARVEAERKATEEAAEVAAKAEAERQRIIRHAEEDRLAAELAAQAERDAAAQRERDAAAAIERAKQEAAEAKQREQRAAEQAERDRIAATEKAEREKEAAIAADRQKREREAAAIAEADRKRAENIAHRRKINREVLAALVRVIAEDHSGNPEEAEKIVTAIITAIAKNEVPHVRIEY